MKQNPNHLDLSAINGADDLIEAIDSAHQSLDEKVEKLLGDSQEPSTARGRIERIREEIKKKPDVNYNITLPLLSLRDNKDRPLGIEERQTAMAVNEAVLHTIYEENDVDFRQRQVEDAIIGGHTSRVITYPAGDIVFVEYQSFGYKEDPNTAIPARLHAEVFTMRDGEPRGGVFIITPDSAGQ